MYFENDFNISEYIIANTETGIRHPTMLNHKPK